MTKKKKKKMKHETSSGEGFARRCARVFTEKNKTHGDPSVSFTCLGKLYAAILSEYYRRHFDPLPAELVALMGAGIKVLRAVRAQQQRTFREDDYVDGFNYLRLARVLHMSTLDELDDPDPDFDLEEEEEECVNALADSEN